MRQSLFYIIQNFYQVLVKHKNCRAFKRCYVNIGHGDVMCTVLYSALLKSAMYIIIIAINVGI